MQPETGSRNYAKRLFLTKFQVFHLMMKNYVECLILLLKTVKRMLYLGYGLLRYVLIYNIELSFT